MVMKLLIKRLGNMKEVTYMAAKLIENSNIRAACFAVALLIMIAVGNPAPLLADTISIAIASTVRSVSNQQ